MAAKTDTIEARLEALEIMVTHQERVIEDLNATITAQWQEIDGLKRRLSRLDEELREIEAGLPAPPVQRPPHY